MLGSVRLQLVVLIVVISAVTSSPPHTLREPRGTFYFTNPSGENCYSNDAKAGYCLFQGCFVNQLRYGGRCAFGFGSCCVAEQTCTQTTNANNTYFINPRPATQLGRCEMIIKRTPQICQLRLDFNDFNLEQPDRTGRCINDIFRVEGTVNPVPDLCGNLTGQHIYVEVNPKDYEAPVVLSVIVKDITLTSRSWNVKTSYLDCDAPHKAPKGCVQYFTGVRGTVKSLNYGLETQGTRLLANMAYPICVRQETGYCGITWQPNPSDGIYAFTLNGNVTKANKEDLGTKKLSRTNCSDNEHFVLIPEGKNDLGERSERHCGLGFPLSVSTKFSPFVIRANMGSVNSLDDRTRGFSLVYQQTHAKTLPTETNSQFGLLT